jgi:hypothetical protein
MTDLVGWVVVNPKEKEIIKLSRIIAAKIGIIFFIKYLAFIVFKYLGFFLRPILVIKGVFACYFMQFRKTSAVLPSRRTKRGESIARFYEGIKAKLRREGKVPVGDIAREFGYRAVAITNRQRLQGEFVIRRAGLIPWVTSAEAARMRKVLSVKKKRPKRITVNPRYIGYEDACKIIRSSEQLTRLLNSGQIKTEIETTKNGFKVRHILRESFDDYIKLRGQKRVERKLRAVQKTKEKKERIRQRELKRLSAQARQSQSSAVQRPRKPRSRKRTKRASQNDASSVPAVQRPQLTREQIYDLIRQAQKRVMEKEGGF